MSMSSGGGTDPKDPPPKFRWGYLASRSGFGGQLAAREEGR
jgi:hypothetical protein